MPVVASAPERAAAAASVTLAPEESACAAGNSESTSVRMPGCAPPYMMTFSAAARTAARMSAPPFTSAAMAWKKIWQMAPEVPPIASASLSATAVSNAGLTQESGAAASACAAAMRSSSPLCTAARSSSAPLRHAVPQSPSPTFWSHSVSLASLSTRAVATASTMAARPPVRPARSSAERSAVAAAAAAAASPWGSVGLGMSEEAGCLAMAAGQPPAVVGASSLASMASPPAPSVR
mmetsp:Transcript_900/g.2444  ORF Transcript_900/g.2444 Transcript_900/m.2444 type:complete len:236 (-) Transcript_900:1020-1727(-)